MPMFRGKFQQKSGKFYCSNFKGQQIFLNSELLHPYRVRINAIMFLFFQFFARLFYYQFCGRGLVVAVYMNNLQQLEICSVALSLAIPLLSYCLCGVCFTKPMLSRYYMPNCPGNLCIHYNVSIRIHVESMCICVHE